LSLLPLLASAALAKAQSWPGDACSPDDPNCPVVGADSYYQDPSQDQGQDPDQSDSSGYAYSTYSTPVYVAVPAQGTVVRQGFGSFFGAAASGVGG
jgi:hypothetical protein